ncbi:MAG: SsrA-binding protein SmpB [Gammaproteobacteria bacterium]|nr:SsrA-binding protein SmpB [Gammaproteobacteria bacterium]MDD9855690.1 SsrA-binding protein SmpB [Gammaproteobacteria bacterium]
MATNSKTGDTAKPGNTAKSGAAKPAKPAKPATIALNRKARFDYVIEQEFEAGVALQGWEVKSLRDGRAQLKESYVIIMRGELFLIGAHFSPLRSASSHIDADPTRRRKLLLHKKEIGKLIGAREQAGYTIVPLSLYWKRGRVKAKIALARGKKQYDKRHAIKQREWQRDRERLFKLRR